MRSQKLIPRLALLLVFIFTLSGAFVLDNEAVDAAATKCYVAINSSNKDVELWPDCSRAGLADEGLRVDGIPEPFPADKCYFWSYDSKAVAKDVTSACSKPPYSNAIPLGTSTDVYIGRCNGQIPLGVDCTQEEADDVAEKAAASDAAAVAQTDASKIVTTEYTGNELVKCGSKQDGAYEVYPSFDIGCKGEGNAIVDMLFAFIRILTGGIGLALIGSIIYAGFEYATASGDPNKTGLAKKRLVSTLLVALPIYLLTYAILNWLIPMAIF